MVLVMVMVNCGFGLVDGLVLIKNYQYFYGGQVDAYEELKIWNDGLKNEKFLSSYFFLNYLSLMSCCQEIVSFFFFNTQVKFLCNNFLDEAGAAMLGALGQSNH